MADIIETKIIGRIHTDFPTKFGIPRQSGVVKELKGRIVFEPEYRNEDALRGIEGFSHLWLIWQFSENVREGWSPTVRPPILGGNTRVGVFATRSPFRPNPIGLSSVKLEGVEVDPHDGTVLVVSGADLMDGTPILDIKPYIPYADSHPEATEGFRSGGWNRMLEVDFPPELLAKVPEKQHKSLIEVLANDPRPSYHHDPDRVYGMPFGNVEVKFSVNERELKVVAVYDLRNN
ncbi:tRNA (N6-threonylcarbamoyladenosine(37)-N6)-methyltransferase TrmO [Anaerovibrio lipolyticus]|uniref:tRNA (N6-threonylcarbamoyladenosine(37)-N6)-methyltransferase TrmO n=1 Tax=Anaerovibrio lipolyticus TaxID=82374 RepID=UPI000487DE94|nr:tRNA (N6-threonylcarbamoyladenosine(37)-N6)-methyltransferase TrmO [Anaerovibrio lipolyticus]